MTCQLSLRSRSRIISAVFGWCSAGCSWLVLHSQSSSRAAERRDQDSRGVLALQFGVLLPQGSGMFSSSAGIARPIRSTYLQASFGQSETIGKRASTILSLVSERMIHSGFCN
ncbi:hypothetical protein PVAP13_1NG181800 [Panicum virgatum]|uniref:Uncharacterized protein n=1 Tax=Panicum virgatum TaxID=38727 RepID=A0A8T0X373_PANVG|nr:hypothetical protein PVAP13_1NG181800 [Panicum virgatum]